MNIFKSTEFRHFLRQYIERLPKRGRGEVTRIAKHLRVSTTLVSQVLAGEKSFTPEQGHALIGYLGLIGIEADYVNFLVQHERAGSEELRKYWSSKLEALREQSLKLANRVATDRTLTEQERTIFYSNPLYSAVRLYASVGENGKSVDEIAERFGLTKARATEILRFLVDTGFCKSEGGRYFLGLQKTHLEQGSPHSLRNLCNWRLRAINYAETLTKEELMYTATVSLSKKDFESLREEMVVFIKKFLEKVHASPAEEVACFNLDFLWIRD